MFGMLTSLAKATVGVVVSTPLAVVADIVTVGGLVTEEKKPYTAQALGDVAKNLKDAVK
jgi:hypothetical protein